MRAPRPPEWDAYYDLRWRVLRAPWDQPRGSERDPLDADACHRLAVTAGGAVIGCGRLHRDPDAPAWGVLRYMAVDPAWREVDRLLFRSLGRAIVEFRAAFLYFQGRFKDLG